MRRGHLRVEDRVLLHLHSYIRYADVYEVPRAMSQKGISEAISVAWSNVPRTINRLKEQDLVDGRTTRVKGEVRRKQVYTLTPHGFAKAEELRKDLGRRRVTVHRAGESQEMDFAEVPKYVGYKVPYLELLRGIDEDGVLDVDRAQTRWEEQVEMVDWTDRAPKAQSFLGRESELEQLTGMVEDNRFVVVHGIAGIGKTTLAARLLEDLKKETNVLWVTLHNWDTLAGVLRQVADFLAETGRKHLRNLLANRPEPGLWETYYSLEVDLKDLRGVIVMDDFHEAGDDLVDLMSMLLEILKDRPSPTLLLVSRFLPSFYDRRYVVVQHVVGEMTLEGLDRAAARAMLKGRGLSDEEFDMIYSTTLGHPLSLELVKSSDAADGRPLKEVMAFIREEVFECLGEGERMTLSAVSVHRANVPQEAALAAANAAGSGPETLDSLVNKGLVADVGGTEVRLHDLVREFFLSRLSEKEREERHREAAEVWGRLGTSEALVERAHHLVRAGETEAAIATLAADPGLALGDSGRLRDMLIVLDEAAAIGDLSPAAIDEADLLRGDALAMMDQVDPAHAIYTRVMDRAVVEGERGQEARVLHRIGLLHSRRRQVTDALEVQQRAIAAFEEVDDEAGAAQCHLAIAEVLTKQEEFDLAVEELGNAHQGFTLVDDRHGVAKACVELASIMLDREDPDVARNYLDEAIDNLNRPEDESLLGLAYYSMGDADRMEEEWQAAIEHYELAVELFQRTGDDQRVANACTYLGDAHLALGDKERAEVYYQRGLDMMVTQ